MNLITTMDVATCLQERDGKGPDSDATKPLVIAATLNAGGNDGGFRTEPGEHLVAQVAATIKQRGRGATDEVMDNLIAHTLTAPDPNAKLKDGKRQDGSRPDRIPVVTHALTGEGHDAGEEEEEGTLHANQTPAVMTGMAVRRLTPTECERLQGFPDGWTCLDVPLEEWARDPEAAAERCRCADSPRYRQMGNAVTVNVVEWIGRRLLEAYMTAAPDGGRGR